MLISATHSRRNEATRMFWHRPSTSERDTQDKFYLCGGTDHHCNLICQNTTASAFPSNSRIFPQQTDFPDRVPSEICSPLRVRRQLNRTPCWQQRMLQTWPLGTNVLLGAVVNLAHVSAIAEIKVWNPFFSCSGGRFLSCNPYLYLTRSCTVICQDKITRAPEKMEALAVRPMLLGNHIKVIQSLNAAFCLQSGESFIGASEAPVGLPKHTSQKELGLGVAECNFQIIRLNICRNSCWKNE